MSTTDDGQTPTEPAPTRLPIKQMKAELDKLNVAYNDCLTRAEIEERWSQAKAGEIHSIEASDPNPDNLYAVYLNVTEGMDAEAFMARHNAEYRFILSSSQLGGDDLSWPQRGWSNPTEFEMEIAHGFRTCNRGLIARGQTKEAADALVKALNEVV